MFGSLNAWFGKISLTNVKGDQAIRGSIPVVSIDKFRMPTPAQNHENIQTLPGEEVVLWDRSFS
jgi:hypothetical protein